VVLSLDLLTKLLDLVHKLSHAGNIGVTDYIAASLCNEGRGVPTTGCGVVGVMGPGDVLVEVSFYIRQSFIGTTSQGRGILLAYVLEKSLNLFGSGGTFLRVHVVEEFSVNFQNVKRLIRVRHINALHVPLVSIVSCRLLAIRMTVIAYGPSNIFKVATVLLHRLEQGIEASMVGAVVP